MALGISVLICCYNSAERLPETLKHLAAQTTEPDIRWEIIVADNASQDATAKIAAEIWRSLGVSHAGFRVISETAPGKSHALKKGIEVALYDYILVCDDDNWLGPDYILTAFHIMNNDPSIGVLGGCGQFWPEQPVREEILPHKIAYVNGPQPWAGTEHWVYGAGSVFRKAILTDLFEKGWEQIGSGKNASKMVEDIELCFICYLNGYRIVSEDRLLFKHFVPIAKQTLDYILSLIYRQSYSYQLLSGYRQLIHHGQLPLRQNLNNIFINNLKAIIVVACRNCHQQLVKKIPLTFSQQAAMKSYWGIFFAYLGNRNMIIRHYNMLLKKQLVKTSFLPYGTPSDQ